MYFYITNFTIGKIKFMKIHPKMNFGECILIGGKDILFFIFLRRKL